MKKLVLSVFDVKAEMYGPTFEAKARGEALRQFQLLVQDKNTMPGRFPADFKLVHLGEFDDLSGVLMACEPSTLAFGSDLIGSGNVTPIGVKE